MEKLLARKGIKVILTEEEGAEVRYLFTEHMLASKIFIYVYEDAYEEPVGGQFIVEAGISVLTYDNVYANEFIVYYNQINDIRPVMFPMILYRFTLDLVEIIENSESSLALTDNLRQASIGAINSTEIKDFRARKNLQDSTIKRVNLILKLIEEGGIAKK